MSRMIGPEDGAEGIVSGGKELSLLFASLPAFPDGGEYWKSFDLSGIDESKKESGAESSEIEKILNVSNEKSRVGVIAEGYKIRRSWSDSSAEPSYITRDGYEEDKSARSRIGSLDNMNGNENQSKCGAVCENDSGNQINYNPNVLGECEPILEQWISSSKNLLSDNDDVDQEATGEITMSQLRDLLIRSQQECDELKSALEQEHDERSRERHVFEAENARQRLECHNTAIAYSKLQELLEQVQHQNSGLSQHLETARGWIHHESLLAARYKEAASQAAHEADIKIRSVLEESRLVAEILASKWTAYQIELRFKIHDNLWNDPTKLARVVHQHVLASNSHGLMDREIQTDDEMNLNSFNGIQYTFEPFISSDIMKDRRNSVDVARSPIENLCGMYDNQLEARGNLVEIEGLMDKDFKKDDHRLLKLPENCMVNKRESGDSVMVGKKIGGFETLGIEQESGHLNLSRSSGSKLGNISNMVEFSVGLDRAAMEDRIGIIGIDTGRRIINQAKNSEPRRIISSKDSLNRIIDRKLIMHGNHREDEIYGNNERAVRQTLMSDGIAKPCNEIARLNRSGVANERCSIVYRAIPSPIDNMNGIQGNGTIHGLQNNMNLESCILPNPYEKHLIESNEKILVEGFNHVTSPSRKSQCEVNGLTRNAVGISGSETVNNRKINFEEKKGRTPLQPEKRIIITEKGNESRMYAKKNIERKDKSDKCIYKDKKEKNQHKSESQNEKKDRRKEHDKPIERKESEKSVERKESEKGLIVIPDKLYECKRNSDNRIKRFEMPSRQHVTGSNASSEIRVNGIDFRARTASPANRHTLGTIPHKGNMNDEYKRVAKPVGSVNMMKFGLNNGNKDINLNRASRNILSNNNIAELSNNGTVGLPNYGTIGFHNHGTIGFANNHAIGLSNKNKIAANNREILSSHIIPKSQGRSSYTILPISTYPREDYDVSRYNNRMVGYLTSDKMDNNATQNSMIGNNRFLSTKLLPAKLLCGSESVTQVHEVQNRTTIKDKHIPTMTFNNVKREYKCEPNRISNVAQVQAGAIGGNGISHIFGMNSRLMNNIANS